MNCGFCGKAFEENRSQPACKACPLGSDCGLILCPHCGYENPGMPRWIAFLKEKFGRKPKAPPSLPTTRGMALPVLDPTTLEPRP